MLNDVRTIARGAGLAVAVVLSFGSLLGCAGPQKGSGETPGAAPTSLVYSPTERMSAERAAQATRPPPGEALRTGVRCRVHLRRDAAGLAGAAPVSIVGASMLSERASVAGTIERVEAEGITLRADGSTYWIPRDVILAVEFPNEPRP
jgi:hypothetical protein